MKTLLLTLLLVVLACACGRIETADHTSQSIDRKKELGQLLAAFTSTQWPAVQSAKAALESLQGEAVPALIALLDHDEKVVLHDTADLIYPGAEQFYGHGEILDYDVDWISVRAGWALEATTFHNFGFREMAIKEADLLNTIAKGRRHVKLTSGLDANQKQELRAQAVMRAKSWWQLAAGTLNRFEAIVEALRSDDAIRQLSVLNWIRGGTTRCDGLSEDSFKATIVPEVKALLRSDNEDIRKQAKLLIEDRENLWLRLKLESESPHY